MIAALRRGAAPGALGAFAALGQAPVDVPALLLAGLAGVILLYVRRAPTPAQAAALGWAFGFGYFGVALHWIVSPFLVDAARHGWMAPFAVVLMAAGGGLFWMAAFWLARRLGPHPGWLVLTLPAAELLRAYLFTGFPWAAPAQASVDVLLGQGLAFVGPHGINVAIVALAAAAVTLIPRMGVMGGPFAAVLALPMIVPVLAPQAQSGDQVIRLIQPNAPQHQKWDPLMIPVFYDRQLSFTAAPADPVLGPPALILWPETAIPWTLERSGTVLREISDAAGGTPVVLGVQRNEGSRYFNALVTLGAQGQVGQIYDKHHLVPFGEYIPLGDLAARIGIHGLAAQEGAGFSRGAGPALLDLGPMGRALPLICYEAVFAHDVNAAPARPDFILHATNDAWFGTHAGPQQHLAQARMRAIEQGLPVARAANTGISAMIDPYGRLLRSLGLGQAGFVDAALPRALPPTLYSRTGDLPLAVFLSLALAVLLLRGALGRRARPQ